eukprot:scaffold61478_cov36-Phaeocystis_antarctica.AAC.1
MRRADAEPPTLSRGPIRLRLQRLKQRLSQRADDMRGGARGCRVRHRPAVATVAAAAAAAAEAA